MMRLKEIKQGKRFSIKHRLMKLMIDLTTKEGAPDIMLALMYRNQFFGKHMSGLFDELMRGPSNLTTVQRELVAAAVSEANECPFCTKMHSSTASILVSPGNNNPENFSTAIDKLRSNADKPTQQLMKFAGQLASNGEMTKDDVSQLYNAGFDKEALEDTIYIVYAFCLINRLANALDFDIPSENGYRFSANILLKKGYSI